MEEIIEKIKVYIELNDKNEIVKVFSSIFEQPTEKSILIGEGYGDKFAHAQSQWFEKPLMKDDDTGRYKYINGKVVEQVENGICATKYNNN